MEGSAKSRRDHLKKREFMVNDREIDYRTEMVTDREMDYQAEMVND